MSKPVSRFLVTGSRSWIDRGIIATALRQVRDECPWQTHPPTMVSGNATGADKLAEKEWARYSMANIERHPADWEQFGHRAGFVRNSQMVHSGVELCLAFVMPCSIRDCQHGEPGHDSHGTAHTIKQCEKAGIPVRIFRPPTAPNPGSSERSPS